jgi:hypothetical protein
MSQQTGIVNIRGKAYQTVALRVQTFREAHPGWRLITEIVFRDGECVVMKATIGNEDGKVIATGHAEEYRADGQINATSALENAETSAIGRALAALGLGGTEFASANEVERAVSGDKPTAPIVSATKIAWEALQPEQQDRMRSIAREVTGSMPNAEKALAALEAHGLDNDEKAGLWHLLDSATRSGIKKAAERKAA